MRDVLVVDDNEFYANLMANAIRKQFAYNVDIAHTAKDARTMVAENKYALLIVDLILPDSEGDFIEEASKSLNVIVTTGFEDEITRKKITSLNIIDYIIKGDSKDFSYLLNIIHRLQMNSHMSVLVVEDSTPIRKHIESLLKVQHLKVMTAADGLEALAILEEHEYEIDLIITDYNMPKMDGLELLKHIRKEFPIEEMPIITLSAIGNEAVIARFLKAGANDYIIKPFSKEEFFCRINLSLNNIEMLKKAKKAASTDHLTGLHNRFYMQSRIDALYKHSSVTNAIAMLDIDFFKKINDTYGHHTGDLALKFLAKYMTKHFAEEDIIRLGGEEFLIFLPGITTHKAIVMLEGLRREIEKATFIDDLGNTISFTISIGIADSQSAQDANGCMDVIKKADEFLYHAKENGRNRIEFEGSI